MAVILVAGVALLVSTLTAVPPVSARARTEPDPKKQALEQRKLPLDDPADFAWLHKKADAMATGQAGGFKLYQVDVELDGSTLRIAQAHLHYFRPARGEWERLLVDITTAGRTRMGGTPGRAWPGSIGGSRTTFGDASPTAAPTKLVAPDEAVRRLNRGALTGPFGEPRRAAPYLRDPSEWRLRVQLVHSAARYQTGNVTLSPVKEHVPWIRRYIQPSIDDAFFKQTAPRSAWVWWTVLQDTAAAGERYEYVYFEPSTGKASSHCAEPSSARAPLTVPCPAPRR